MPHWDGRRLWLLYSVPYLAGVGVPPETNLDSVKLWYYVEANEGSDEPPDCNDNGAIWKCGPSGTFPIPDFQWHDEARVEKLANNSIQKLTLRHRATVDLVASVCPPKSPEEVEAQRYHAAWVVQRNYRRYLLLNLAKSRFTLKLLSEVTSIKLR
eukprot:CAMPEP_0184534922 /NCGR_PEP_ID=MMETSP0198_2-20121128/15601_1 /TAXON_ID=1112570 /ORGANISM="Thraustochytrium sp., Strain LLF1b" /LENGTH=154 /DNA_ID=CAMNT_0026927903 /DNA_START=29 /DNA_END=490 /DNA_ORIENTATION=-